MRKSRNSSQRRPMSFSRIQDILYHTVQEVQGLHPDRRSLCPSVDRDKVFVRLGFGDGVLHVLFEDRKSARVEILTAERDKQMEMPNEEALMLFWSMLLNDINRRSCMSPPPFPHEVDRARRAVEALHRSVLPYDLTGIKI